MKNILIMVLGVILFFGITYGIYKFQRYMNYKLSYKTAVELKIQEMVKQECLK